jgi:hypothetical protein
MHTLEKRSLLPKVQVFTVNSTDYLLTGNLVKKILVLVNAPNENCYGTAME